MQAVLRGVTSASSLRTIASLPYCMHPGSAWLSFAVSSSLVNLEDEEDPAVGLAVAEVHL